MAFGGSPGLITDGIGADSYRSAAAFMVQTGPNTQILPGATLKRNLLAVVGRNDQYPNLSLGDQAVAATNPGAGFVAGVVANTGRPNLQNSQSVSTGVRVSLVQQGVVPVRVAALAGGTAVTIGSLIGFSAAIGASSSDIPTVQTTYTPGAMVGVVTGFQITSATGAAVVTPGSQTVPVPNTDGITTATALTIDPSLIVQETVTPSAVTVGVRAQDSITIGGTFSAGSVLTANINGTVVSYTVQASDTNLAGVAASFAKAINASGVVSGFSPILSPAQVTGAVIYLTANAQGTAANAYTLSTTSTGGTTTATAGSATFTGGVTGSITATFSQPHASNAVLIGQNITSGATLVPVPTGTGAINVDTVLVDVAMLGA